MKIAFRTDASPTIGSGHVMRCIALAQALKARGAEIEFVSQQLPEHLSSLLDQAGFPVRSETAPCDWLVVDHYDLDADWERAQRPSAGRIMVIDDLVRRHDCDLVLDQNILSAANPYEGKVPQHCRVCLGPTYALLRPEFAAARERRAARRGEVRRVLVCFGGADPANHTAAALEALRPHAARLERIDVVLGPASPSRREVEDACGGMARARLHLGTDDMAGLLVQADLAIGAGGSMTWERACLGVPTLAFGIAANQVAVLDGLFEAGCAAGVSLMEKPDAAQMAAWVSALVSDAPLLRGMAARSRALGDGRGASRIADALLGATILFRRATHADSEHILRWRSDPRVRGQSLDGGAIDARTHAAWLEKVLADPARVLLVAEDADGPVGVVRFDLQGSEATISVYRTPEAMDGSRGLIREATFWLRHNHPEVATVIAEVLADNSASLAAFRKAGYSDWKCVLRSKTDERG